jgi:hypothetical protein
LGRGSVFFGRALVLPGRDLVPLGRRSVFFGIPLVLLWKDPGFFGRASVFFGSPLVFWGEGSPQEVAGLKVKIEMDGY